MTMFDFLSDPMNYEQRKVARHEDGGMLISTAAVSDADDPYETAVWHPQYNGGKVVTVETYLTRDAAERGHQQWVARMTQNELPARLYDVSSSGIAALRDDCGDEWRIKERQDAEPNAM